MLALVACLLAPSTALARSGDPDRTFGGDGRVVLGFGPYLSAAFTDVAIDSRGRIVAAGFYSVPFARRPVVFRFNPDGSLDRSFGAGGVVEPQLGGEGSISGIAVDGADRIVLGGSLTSMAPDLVVARLLDSGDPDPDFAGGDGLLTVDVAGTAIEHATDLALDPQGRILLAVSVVFSRPELQFAVMRVTESGAPDSSFGEDAIAGVNVGAAGFTAGVAVDSQGRVVLVGQGGAFKGLQFAAARFDSAGRPDPGFDGDGWTMLGFGSAPPGERVVDVAVDAQDRLLLVGGGGSRSALATRLLADGSPDPGFDGDGRVQLPLRESGSSGVAIDGEGRILMTGTMSAGTTSQAFLARLRPTGALDRSFGGGGIVRDGFSTTSASATAVAVDAAGRYLIAG
ncbi:MAG TPA: hypothetical protein VFY69_05925, partial [Solirubrobacterales bacterium]|nr:hypothetical protein [Solirubrobacterales bacterium]